MLIALLALTAAATAPVAAPAQPALREQIARADADLFSLYFTGHCDVPRLRGMLAEGAEFYHQKHGAAPAERFVGHYLEDCRRRARPDAVRTRREPVPGSLAVSPIGAAGAFQTVEVNFYARRGAAPERLVGCEKLAQLWLRGSDGKWRLSRSFSYDLRRP